MLAVTNRQWFVPAVLVLGAMLTDGATEAVVLMFVFGVFLLLFSVDASQRRLVERLRVPLTGAATVAAAVALMAYRVVPAVNFLQATPSFDSTDDWQVVRSAHLTLALLKDSLFGGDVSLGAWSLSPLVGVLALVGLAAAGRRWFRYLLVGGLALWICAAAQLPPAVNLFLLAVAAAGDELG
ncbi:MAG: hypothetical protein M5R36_24210 [Deltaproteobacteria bacterium]|nr:hypothetical protein [Deltaproteobacteria bacterium]